MPKGIMYLGNLEAGREMEATENLGSAKTIRWVLVACLKIMKWQGNGTGTSVLTVLLKAGKCTILRRSVITKRHRIQQKTSKFMSR